MGACCHQLVRWWQRSSAGNWILSPMVSGGRRAQLRGASKRRRVREANARRGQDGASQEVPAAAVWDQGVSGDRGSSARVPIRRGLSPVVAIVTSAIWIWPACVTKRG